MDGLSRKTLERMFTDSKFSDIILLSSDGQEFHARTKILQSFCPYFMVARNLEKGVNGVLTLDIRGKILAEVRRWIYIKTIDVQKFELEDLLDLFSIADSYGLEDLKDKVEDLLIEYPISEENVLKMFERADQAESKKLIKRGVNYLCENIQSVLQNTKVFNKIPSDLVLEINRKVPLQKIPNYHLAIGQWAKGRQTAMARKVLQETLNFKQMPNTLLVEMLETMLLKDDDIFAEQVIHTLTSELANSLTLSGDSKFSDILLLSNDGQEFHATTRILQSNSSYFMVARNLEKAVDGKLALDIRGKILAEVRRWIYIKTIDVQKFKLEDFFDLLSIAESYGMEDLKDKVEDLLNKYEITDENVLEILLRDLKFGYQKLVDRCKHYLRVNIERLLAKPEVFNGIPPDLIIEINQKVPLQKIPNYYVAIGRWAQRHHNGVARKVFQETLNVEEMPKEILVDVINASLLRADKIFTEEMIQVLSSGISNSLTLRD